jgi:hypothetical protein
MSSMAIVLLAAPSCQDTSRPILTTLDLRAIAVAEAFVREHGYTDRPADAAAMEQDDEWLSLREMGVPLARVLEVRHNNVVSQAYGLSRNRFGDKPGWTVYFQLHPDHVKKLNAISSERYDSSALALGLNPDFGKPGIFHMDISLASAEIRLRPGPQEVERRAK